MSSLKEFTKNYFKNNGQYVFMSLLIAKICGFVSSIAIVRLITQKEFGTVTIVASVFAIFAAFNGFGSAQGLLRFGSLTEDGNEKQKLSDHFFYQGFIYQLILTLIFFISSFFFVQKYQDIFYLFGFFAFRLIGFYFFNHIQSYFRIYHDNKSFSAVNNFVNIFGVVLIVALSYLYGIKGYLAAIALSPFLSLFWYSKCNLSGLNKVKIYHKDLWNYSFHAVFTGFLSDLLFSLDILLLGFLLNEKEVAHYKVAIILPSNLTFLALSLLQADFSKIVQQSKDLSFLRNYIRNYYKFFIPLSLIIFLLGYLFSKEILTVFFGKMYAEDHWVFVILLSTFLINILLRNLYGNLLSAVGEMKCNTIVSIGSLSILILFSFLLIDKLGTFGMGISIFVSMIFSGILSYYFFKKYLQKLK